MPRKKARLSYTPQSLIRLCSAIYFCSYLARCSYATVMVDIIAGEGFPRTSAAAPLTALFISYGAGQIISGFFADRLRPERFVFCGLLTSALMNFFVPFCRSAMWITVLWAINGLAQAFLWPPLVRIMAGALSDANYKKGVTSVTSAGLLGNVFLYLAAPLCITLGGWRTVFYITAAAVAAVAFFWLIRYHRLETHMREPREDEERIPVQPATPARFTPAMWGLFAAILLAMIAQGILREGITTWTPPYLSETFGLGSAVVILNSIALPLFSVVAIRLTAWLNRRWLSNELLFSGLLFSVCLLSLGLLKLFPAVSSLLSALLLAVAVGCMLGNNLLLNCIAPKSFANTGKMALISGVFNSGAYAGSALSTYGIAVVTNRFGWDGTVIAWALVALFGILCALPCTHAWQRFRNGSAENRTA